MPAYNIAYSRINIEGNNSYLEKRLEPFRSVGYDQPDISVSIQRCSHIEVPAGELVVNDYVKWLRKNNGENGFHVYRMDDNGSMVLADLETDGRWCDASIRCVGLQLDPRLVIKPEWADWSEFYSFLLLGVAFRNHLLWRDGIIIHASSIALEGKGIIFTAPSGTGKSTHVRLWEQYMGDKVKVVNDDTPAVRLRDGVPMLCGTPWSGSSDKFENMMVPLHTMVILEQAPENSIKKLSPVEVLPKIMPRVFLPYFDEKLMEKAYDIIESLIEAVPVYLLKCRPDREAMELVYKCVR